MAKQLYDYWFVQFDFPNEDGKPYKSSGGAMVEEYPMEKMIYCLIVMVYLFFEVTI